MIPIQNVQSTKQHSIQCICTATLPGPCLLMHLVKAGYQCILCLCAISDHWHSRCNHGLICAEQRRCHLTSLTTWRWTQMTLLLASTAPSSICVNCKPRRQTRDILEMQSEQEPSQALMQPQGDHVVSLSFCVLSAYLLPLVLCSCVTNHS